MSTKPQYWKKTQTGYIHKDGFTLTHTAEEGFLNVGGVWELTYDSLILARKGYSTSLCELRVLRWANSEITSYKRFKEGKL